MSRVEPARWTINRLPARRPFPGVTVVRRRIKSQAGNHSERVTLPCVDGDPFRLGRDHRSCEIPLSSSAS